MRGPLIEVCIESVEDAMIVTAGGSDRIELCSALALGGLTPSLGAMVEVRNATSLPIMTMVRPRAAGFCYSDYEWVVMRRDIDTALERGSDGIVFGALTDSGEVDVRRTKEAIGQIAGRSSGRIEIVFHRAFDFTARPLKALDQLIDLGVNRVLTSGQRAGALEGASLIGALIERSGGRIEVLPGGGIGPGNAADLVARTGCRQVHVSLRARIEDASVDGRPTLNLSTMAADGAGDSNQLTGTSAEMLAALVTALRR